MDGASELGDLCLAVQIFKYTERDWRPIETWRRMMQQCWLTERPPRSPRETLQRSTACLCSSISLFSTPSFSLARSTPRASTSAPQPLVSSPLLFAPSPPATSPWDSPPPRTRLPRPTQPRPTHPSTSLTPRLVRVPLSPRRSGRRTPTCRCCSPPSRLEAWSSRTGFRLRP